jgi:hypothetical protein
MSEAPDVKKVKQVIEHLPPDQFSELCAELGLIESQLGNSRAAQIKALLALQTSASNPQRLVRTIRHVWPEAFDAPPPKPKRKRTFSLRPLIGPVVGLLALLAIIAAGALILMNAINPNSQAVTDVSVTLTPVATRAVVVAPRSPTPVTPTITNTPKPTRTPNLDATLTATYAPSATPTATATRTPKPTNTPGKTTPTNTAVPTSAVSIIYNRVELSKPPSNTSVTSSTKWQMQWLIPRLNGGLQADERFRLRVWQNQQVVSEVLTSDKWYTWGGPPNGQVGTYQWSVAIVKVNDANKTIGIIGPESEQWTITWQ